MRVCVTIIKSTVKKLCVHTRTLERICYSNLQKRKDDVFLTVFIVMPLMCLDRSRPRKTIFLTVSFVTAPKFVIY